ncbi:MAG: methyltransferase domain-containing protein [Gemmatimonadaceae bacterium]
MSGTTSAEYVGNELPVFALAANWKRYVSDILRPYIVGDVLEVGAGMGAAAVALMQPAVTRWVGLEPDPELAAIAAATPIDPTGRVAQEIHTGTLADLPSDATFDTILYIDVLEHIEGDRAELELASRHLRPGGHLIVLSPAFQFVYSPFDKAIGHFRRYTSASLRAVVPARLHVVLSRYADALGLLLSIANRFLLRQSEPSRHQILTWDRVVIPTSRIVDHALSSWIGRSVIVVAQRPGAEVA